MQRRRRHRGDTRRAHQHERDARPDESIESMRRPQRRKGRDRAGGRQNTRDIGKRRVTRDDLRWLATSQPLARRHERNRQQDAEEDADSRPEKSLFDRVTHEKNRAERQGRAADPDGPARAERLLETASATARRRPRNGRRLPEPAGSLARRRAGKILRVRRRLRWLALRRIGRRFGLGFGTGRRRAPGARSRRGGPALLQRHDARVHLLQGDAHDAEIAPRAASQEEARRSQHKDDTGQKDQPDKLFHDVAPRAGSLAGKSESHEILNPRDGGGAPPPSSAPPWRKPGAAARHAAGRPARAS